MESSEADYTNNSFTSTQNITKPAAPTAAVTSISESQKSNSTVTEQEQEEVFLSMGWLY